jgi:hypothetical protein
VASKRRTMMPTAIIISRNIPAKPRYWSHAGISASVENRRSPRPHTARSAPQSRKEIERKIRPAANPGVTAKRIAQRT